MRLGNYQGCSDEAVEGLAASRVGKYLRVVVKCVPLIAHFKWDPHCPSGAFKLSQSAAVAAKFIACMDWARVSGFSIFTCQMNFTKSPLFITYCRATDL